MMVCTQQHGAKSEKPRAPSNGSFSRSMNSTIECGCVNTMRENHFFCEGSLLFHGNSRFGEYSCEFCTINSAQEEDVHVRVNIIRGLRSWPGQNNIAL